ncbi:MAG: lipid biosynthesis B12-binding/radical SAM protein [Syntrophales bacterium]
MRVLLISANKVRAPFPVYPLALDYLAGALQPMHTVRFLDLMYATAEEAVPDTIAEFAPDCVGISIRNIDNVEATHSMSFIEGYRDLIRILRRATSAPLILGGAGFTLFPTRLLKELGADYGVAGEGERLAALLTALESGTDPRHLPGVVTPTDDYRAPQPWKGTPRRLTMPDNPLYAAYIKNGGMLNLQTKRGCPFQCIYCTYPLIEGHHLRRVDPEEVASTAKRLMEIGARYLYITDGVFNSDADHCLAIADAFRAAGITLPWCAFFAPLKTRDDFYPRLAKAGLTHVEFGTESLSDRMLGAYHKPFCRADVVNAHQASLEAGLHVAHYFLLGGPGETRQSVEETLLQVESLDKAVFFFFCGVRIYPGTELHAMALSSGQLSPGTDLLEPVFYHPNAIAPSEIEEMIKERAAGRPNWVVGSGSDMTNKIMARMYAKGHIGPLWEKLIP